MQNTHILDKKHNLSTQAKRYWLVFFFLLLTVTTFIGLSFSWSPSYITYINTKSVIISAILCALIYFIFLQILSPFLSSAIITMFATVTRFASNQKEINTSEPIIYGDLTHLNHLELAINFVPKTALIASLALIISFFVLIICKLYNNYNNNRNKTILFFLLLATLTYDSKDLTTRIVSAISTFGINYYDWDWHHNAVENGLLIHLLQTSIRPSPENINAAQIEEFYNYSNSATITKHPPELFISILCEACWYDKDLFKESFQPLFDIGGIELRGISPIIGGGTPNASLEMLTGLPINNSAISGVVYQEYRDLIGNFTSTLPSHLLKNGVQTFSAHNFTRRFWFRDKVEPKLGFEAFYGIEDMDPVDRSDDYYPRDSILYNFALREIKKTKNKSSFIHLATVYTHSPFVERDNDGGNNHYKEKLKVSIADMTSFINSVKEIKPDTVFLIYGDHKPRLKVLDSYKSADKHNRGDMPIIIIDHNRDRIKQVKNSLDGKPFYCYATGISEIYYGMELPISNYTNKICQNYHADKYEEYSKYLPAWIYTATIFN